MGSQNPSPDEKTPGQFRAICQLAEATSRDARNTYSKGPRLSCDMKNVAENLHSFQPAKITSREVFHLPNEATSSQTRVHLVPRHEVSQKFLDYFPGVPRLFLKNFSDCRPQERSRGPPLVPQSSPVPQTSPEASGRSIW